MNLLIILKIVINTKEGNSCAAVRILFYHTYEILVALIFNYKLMLKFKHQIMCTHQLVAENTILFTKLF